MTLQTNDGRLIVISGSSRCGKTAKATRLARGFDAVFVWDIEAQWCKQAGYKRVDTLQDLKKIVKSGRKGKYAFVSAGDIKKEFELFSMCAFFYADNFGRCCVVAEELADVTSIAKAGDNWGMCCRRGLKRGMTIIAISQRWSEADKTAFGNASDFYLFRLSSMDDIRYISKKTRVTVERLEGLKPLEYIHFDALTGIAEGSKLTFK